MDFHLQSVDEVLKEVDSSKDGLTQEKAASVLTSNGKNKLNEGKKDSFFERLLKQLSDPMIVVLLAAALVSTLTSIYQNESFTDVFIILFVVIVNAFLGIYQESKAEKAIEALKEMSGSVSKVIRDGVLCNVKSEDIVVGDIVMLEAGDSVPADLRIIESVNLKVDESMLTGESIPVNKKSDILIKGKEDITLADRKNMLYMGSNVVYGNGKAVVVKTGMNTEMGKIADAIVKAGDDSTPLQKKLNQLSKILSFLVIGICAVLFIFSIIKEGSFNPEVAIDTFMLAVSLAVAAIPEGLAAVVTVQLSIGVTRMAKQNAIIRKLSAVETLGCTQVICSDKTGTLTKNQMTVVDSFSFDKDKLQNIMALCNNAEIGGEGKVIGEPTEVSLFNWANDSISVSDLKKEYVRFAEIPFDSERKMMSTFHKSSNGAILQYTKGAPDVIIDRCSKYFDGKNICDLTDQIKGQILSKNREMTDKALRVLAASFKTLDKEPKNLSPHQNESDLVFVGLCGMIDPIRQEALEAIRDCKSAGIHPIMITGDHKNTAVAIGKSLGIITNEDQALTGVELDKISDEELSKTIENYSVFARVQPEHKTRIVNAYRSKNMVVAMTGDGVNDAPSIKSADIGVGMGITGTDVTKNVADMILSDDNFSTIVFAVAEGRRIYDNIRKAIQFLLSSNISEVISIFVATILGFTILKPVHILWINLITDTFPALALGMEKAEPNLMKQKPRKPSDGIFADGMAFDVIYQGILISILTLVSYFVGHYIESGVFEITNSNDGTTMAFLTMSMAEIFHSFNVRSRKNSIFSLNSKNMYMLGSMIMSFILTILVIYVPALSGLFGFESISLFEYTVSLLIAISVIPIVEIVKVIERKIRLK